MEFVSNIFLFFFAQTHVHTVLSGWIVTSFFFSEKERVDALVRCISWCKIERGRVIRNKLVGISDRKRKIEIYQTARRRLINRRSFGHNFLVAISGEIHVRIILDAFPAGCLKSVANLLEFYRCKSVIYFIILTLTIIESDFRLFIFTTGWKIRIFLSKFTLTFCFEQLSFKLWRFEYSNVSRYFQLILISDFISNNLIYQILITYIINSNNNLNKSQITLIGIEKEEIKRIKNLIYKNVSKSEIYLFHIEILERQWYLFPAKNSKSL